MTAWLKENGKDLAIWVYRALVAIGLFLIGYAALLGDTRWIPRKEAKTVLAPIIREVIQEEIEPLSEVITTHVANKEVHMSFERNVELFLTRREAEAMQSDLIRRMDQMQSMQRELNTDVKNLLRTVNNPH